MSLRDAFDAMADLLRDPDFGFGESVTMYDTSIASDDGIPFDGVVEIGSGPLQMTSEEDAVYEQGTIEVPVSIVVNSHCWFLARGERWNFVGVGGRDVNLQTINVQSAKPRGTRTAKRK